MPEGERERLERYPEFAPAGVAGRPHAPEHLVERRRDDRGRGHLLRVPRRARPLARARRLPHRRRAVQRRPALRRLGRPRRPARRRLGHAPRLGPHARRAAPARDGRPPGSRPRDDARRRARAQPVPGRAARRAGIEVPGAARDARRPAARSPVVARDPHDRGAVRAVRLARASNARLRGHGLFERTSGEASDVVHKEMYSFVDRGDRSLTLRPEGTAPIARAYVEHGLAQEPQPVKAYAIAPMYRYSRPGRGRYREHWQLSLEVIGSADPAVDAEVIQFYSELLRRLGVTEWELRLNSIGDANCRPAVRRPAERVARRASRARRRGSRAQARDERPAGLRREEPAGARGASRCAEDRGGALRRVPRALRQGQGRPRPVRSPVRARPGARARPRLLHAHDLRVRRAGGERQLDDLRRRPLRRARGGRRRAGDPRHRLRRRPRAAAARDRTGGRDRGPAASRPLPRVRGAGAARAASPADREAGARRAARSTPTTLAAR